MESRIRLILMMLIMTVTVFSIWFRDVDSTADNGNPEGLRSQQWDNKNICLERPGRWIGEMCVPATVQLGVREGGKKAYHG